MAVIQRVINAKGQKIKAKISATLHTAAVTNRIVTTTNMVVGTYTVAAQPYCPSKITVTATASGTADTMGTITIVGTDLYDRVQSEVIVPVAGSTVSGYKIFKTVTRATGAGWVIDAGNGQDTIVIGVPASGGIEAKGHNVTLAVLTGNVWINDTAVATAAVTSLPLIAGDVVENLLVSDTLSLISDGSGGTFYAIVWDV